MSVKEFHQWLKYPLTKFSERVFGMLDLDNSGYLDFNEFLIGVWNWNTYDATLIAKLAYNIFDVDRSGSIDMAEAAAMIRMIYNVPRADKEIMAKIDINNDGSITLKELGQLVDTHNYVLNPAFDLQRALRQKIIGVKYWEAEMMRRRVYFSGYDAGAQSSWESIKKILEIKHQARVEEEERARSLKEMELRERNEARKQADLKLKEEMQARRAKRAEERRAARESKEVKAERESAERLRVLEGERDDEVVFGDLAIRLVNREKYWKAYEDWVVRARTARNTTGATRLRLAVGPDAALRFEEDLETFEGYREFWTEVLAIWTMEFTDRLYQRGGSSNETYASLLLRPPIDELDEDWEPTFLAGIRIRFASRKVLKRIKATAKGIILESFRGTEDDRVSAELGAQERTQEDFFRTERLRQVGVFGTKKSKWERLWDADAGLPYWTHWESAESHWEKPAVCHVCDASIPPDDVMCFKCNNARSDFNQAIYDELHPPDLERELRVKGEDDDEGTLVDDGLLFDDDGNVVPRQKPPGKDAVAVAKPKRPSPVARYLRRLLPSRRRVRIAIPRHGKLPPMPRHRKGPHPLRRFVRWLGFKKRPRRKPAPSAPMHISQVAPGPGEA